MAGWVGDDPDGWQDAGSDRERRRPLAAGGERSMVFGFFKRGHRLEPVVAEPVMAEPATAVVLINPEVQPINLGPILWQDVRYGMTMEEVQQIRPDAIRSADGEAIADGSMAELKIPHLQLGAHNYAALFYMKGGYLTQVTIRTNGGPKWVDFNDITNALRLRYGREVRIKESLDGLSVGEWLSADGINITLVFQATIDLLNVVFQYRYADAARQL